MFRIVLGIALMATASVAVAQRESVTAQGTVHEAKLIVQPTELHFDTVEVGKRVCKKLTLINGGNATLYITGMSFSDPAYRFGPGYPYDIAPGDSDFVTVCFEPRVPGPCNKELSIKHGTPGRAVPLFGYAPGASYQHVAVDDSVLEFGNTLVNTQSLRTLTIRNSGGPANLTIRSQTVTGRGFTLVRPAGQSVKPGDSTLATVLYAPITASLDSGSLRIETDDPSKPAISIPLRGRCLPVPGPSLYCPVNALFMVVDKHLSHVDSVLIRNIGSSDLVLSSQTIDVDTLEFSIIREARSPLASQDSTTIVICFTDHDASYGHSDYHYGVLRLVTNDPARPTFDLPLVTEAIGAHADPLPGAPDGFTLRPNYPNPFPASGSAGTTLEYDLAEAATVRLSVYSCTGRRVAVLDEAWREAGRYRCRWTPERLPPGLYTAVLTVATRSGARSVSRLRMICTN